MKNPLIHPTTDALLAEVARQDALAARELLNEIADEFRRPVSPAAWAPRTWFSPT
jgi:hypothetical protein